MSPDAETLRRWPDSPALLPLLPLVHSAWADGVLSPDEVRAFRGELGELGWLDDDDRRELDGWLDPDQPPHPVEIADLEERIRSVDRKGPPPPSLTDVGLALADVEGVEPGLSSEAVAAVRALEARLGVVPREAVARTLGARQDVAAADPPPPPAFEPGVLRRFLDGDRAVLRDRILDILRHPSQRIPEGIDHDEYRERTLDAVQHLADEGLGGLAYPEEFGGANDPGAAIAAFETLAFGDLSVVIKFGVQFGLFGGSILQLGTRRHHEAYLARTARLELPGCYAMTETGHGSNVRDLETTATYDPDADELVVHSPSEQAGKDWIGNAARHGRLATVFARLVVDGEDHGVHAVLVPIRDDRGRPLQGVRIEDRGLKEGLNGVDNGRLWFDHVRVPRTHLLDRFAEIDESGRYHSPIPSQGRRFFTMLGTLVAGRISIGAASVSAAKTGLTIAIRYGERRRQFGPEGASEVPILDYLVHQRLLLPRLATTYGLHFALRRLQRAFADADGAADQEIEVQAAGLKAYASWHCVDALQAGREACGGQGYLAANRFGRLKADTDVFTTFEGANPVLMQLVAKGLLSRYRHDMGDLRFWGAVRWLAERAQTRVAELNPIVTRRTDPEHLVDPEFHAAAFRYREDRLLRSVAMRLKRRIDDGIDSFDAMNECQDHLVELADAHTERLILDAFQEAVARAPTPGLSEALAQLSALFALSRMEAHRGWYLEAGYFEAAKSRAVRARVTDLCGDVREFAGFLVDAFGIPDEVLAAPAAL
ncbi:MAG: acyl-CoA dehydrogenase [Longimicrobiales bacterium]